MQLKRRMDNKGVTLLVENLEEKGYGKGDVSLLAESLDVGCGNKGVELLADNLEEKGSGNGGVALLAKSMEFVCGNQGVALPAKYKEKNGVATEVWHCCQKFRNWMWQSRCGTTCQKL